MSAFLAFTIIGIVTGAIYAIAATGLVVTYSTSGIFNIAHGAIGMLMAFTFWELRVNRHWPTPLAFIAVVFVVAPALGAVIERVLIRRLRGASVAQTLVVTVGLMVMLLGIGQSIWTPTTGRELPPFFGRGGFRLLGVFVTWHDTITIISGAGVALFLWFLLSRTRIGIAMRAVVDDRNLLSLNGARPDRVSMLSWALGASLASLAGILLAPVLQLNHLVLTLLVVNAYAAAMVGRLRSLPMTYVGGLALGLVESYTIGYVHLQGWLLGLRPSIPTIFLFAALLLLPESRLRAARLAGAVAPRVPTRKMSFAGGALLIGAAVIFSRFLGGGDLIRVGQGLAFALVMLSLVPLTGYGGQVSLAQMTFAGIGAFAMAKVGGNGNIFGLVAAAALAAGVGALIALPALRLQGLYLALSTMAFAALMDNMFFPNQHVFSNLGSVPVARLKFLGMHFESERAYFVLLAVAFALLSLLVIWVRRGSFGRKLAAMRDSQVACATLGLSLARTKLMVFMLSAGMAGVAGALFAGLRGSAGPTDFLMFQSLPILLLAVIGGITTASGALIGGLSFALLGVVQEKIPAIGGLTFLLVGFGALSVGRNPNGVSFQISQAIRRLFPSRFGQQTALPEPVYEEEVESVAASAS
jgi:branched-chain amino acid transport system permease protein